MWFWLSDSGLPDTPSPQLDSADTPSPNPGACEGVTDMFISDPENTVSKQPISCKFHHFLYLAIGHVHKAAQGFGKQ